MEHVARIEALRRGEQARLDALKDQSRRNRLGQFATPPSLSLEIARYARALWGTRGPVRFLDPAIGTGSFYSALRQTFAPDMIETAAGVELDPHFADAARRLWGGTGLCVSTADFTRSAPPAGDERFNLVLTNPPYVRHHHLSAKDKLRLKAATLEQLGLDVSGLASLYCYFLFLCHRWMAEGGLAVWLIPSEFMEVNYGAAVKRYLCEHVTLQHIHRFDPLEVQFDDALVTSAVVLFEKGPAPPSHQVEFSYGGTLSRPDASEHIALSDLRSVRKWTSLPHSTSNERDDARTRMGDLFIVKRGLATGSNSFFIIPRATAGARGIPDFAMKPVLPSPRHLRATVIESEADGWPAISEQLALIDCTLPENEVEARYPDFWAYLDSGKRQGIHAGYLASRRMPWYSQEHREAAPFLCTYMGRQRDDKQPFRFIWNKSIATAANVYLLLYPKPALARVLRHDPSAAEAVFRALNEVDGRSMIDQGRVYGGGLHKLEPNELAALPADMIAEAAGLVPATTQLGFSF